MLKKFLFIGAIFSMVACNNSDTETTTTDSTATTGTESDLTDATATSSFDNFDESASYVSLKTNQPIKVKRDATRRSIVDFESNEPITYYFYNPATRDTFDWSGNVVNSYLIRGNDGDYTLDEARWRTKMDDDGDVKAKDGDDSKIKIEADGEAKIKTDSSKIKISDKGIKTKKKD